MADDSNNNTVAPYFYSMFSSFSTRLTETNGNLVNVNQKEK